MPEQSAIPWEEAVAQAERSADTLLSTLEAVNAEYPEEVQVERLQFDIKEQLVASFLQDLLAYCDITGSTEGGVQEDPMRLTREPLDQSLPSTTQRPIGIEEDEASIAPAPLDTDPAGDEVSAMANPIPPELIATISDLKEAVIRFDERAKYLGEQIGQLGGSLTELRQEVRDNRTEITSTVEALRQEAKAGREQLSFAVQGLRTELSSALTEMRGEAREDRKQLSSAVQGLRTELSSALTEMRGEAREDRKQLSSAVQGLRTELSSALTEMRDEARKDREQLSSAVQGLRTELSSALTEMRGEARKDREQFTAAMTTLQQESEAGRTALASTLQEVNLSLTGAIGNLNDWTKRHADDIATLRSEGIGKTAFWSGISIIVALILGLAAIYFSTMKP